MKSRPDEWTFTEEERDKVCNGEICPRCKSSNIKYAGCAPDGINLNKCFDCLDCEEGWEGN